MTSPLTGLKVLIVEDDALTAEAAVQMLEDAGAHPLTPCATVTDALAVIAREPVDLALLDVNLNGMRSNAIASALAAKDIPFVAATGYGVAAELAGATIVVDKPYAPEKLRAAMERAIMGVDAADSASS